MEVVDQIIRNRFLGSEIELGRSYKEIVEYINHRTPTAYGKVRFIDEDDSCDIAIDDPQVKNAVLALISDIQCNNNYSITLQGELEDFIKNGERLVKILHGGSAGQILLLKDEASGEHFVRKVAARFGVEGNGTPKLEAEINFLLEISRVPTRGELRKLFPRVLDHSYTERFITLDQEYIGEGKNVLTLLSQNEITPEEHVVYVDALLSSLIPHGYALESRLVPKEESLEHLEDYYLRRAEGRIRFFQNCEDFVMDFPTSKLTSLPELVGRDSFSINGVEYKNPLEVIAKIKADNSIAEILRPRTESFCAHGDLTFLNMVFDDRSQAYKLIDNRGHIGNWDALYDFGKLKFTLSGFGQVMLRDFDLSEGSYGDFHLHMTGNADGKKALAELNNSFFEDISSNEAFVGLVKDEPRWQERILFAEAIHYLSDIPHRLLLDQSPKNAVGVFLLGVMYLNKVYDSLRK